MLGITFPLATSRARCVGFATRKRICSVLVLTDYMVAEKVQRTSINYQLSTFTNSVRLWFGLNSFVHFQRRRSSIY